MPRLDRRSLLIRLLAWLLPISLTATLAISFSTYCIAHGAILRELEQGVLAFASVAAAQTKAFFEQRRNDLATIAQSPLFRDHYMNVEYGLLQEAEMHRREIEGMLAGFARRAKVYPQILYLGADGKVICRIRDGRAAPPGAEALDPETLRALKSLRPGQHYGSDIRRAPRHPAPLIRYAMGLYDEAGRPRGALVFDCSLASVYATLGRLQIGLSGRSYLTQRGERPSPSGSPRRYDHWVTASAVVPGTPWSIVSSVNRDEFLDRLQPIRLATILISLIASALMILILANQVRVLLKPIQALADAAAAFAGGALDVRVGVSGPGEVATLAAAFNTMAGRLERRTGDLVHRVRELTALHRMNEAVLRQLGRGAVGKACLEAAVDGLGFGRGILYWVDEERGEIVGECVHGMAAVGLCDDEVRARRVPLGSGNILAEAARERRAIHVEDPAHDPRCDAKFAARLGARAFCAAPIVVRDRVIAVLAVDAGPANSSIAPERMRSLSLFCGAAGLALDNAQLMEATLRSEARHRTAVENSPYAVVSLDQNFRITLWNRRAEALFGYQPTEAYGRTLALVLGEQPYRALRRRVETEGAVRQAEVAGTARDGRRLDLNVSWTGQSAGAGEAREWFVVIQDETEKKRLQDQLIQSEKMSAVGSLIAGVAHELNNPLAAVTGFAELLKDLPAKPEEREDLRHLHESALRCRDIVQGLLLFVRKEKTARQRVSLNRAVQATLALFEYRLIKTEAVMLDVELDAAAPVVAADFQKMQQVLVNLLTNAVDALKSRVGPRRIRVRTRTTPAGSEVAVEDTGPGVPPELRQRIFEPFFTTKPAGLGTGLGLSISAQIIADVGGVLRCEQGPEGGARFTASFPLCPAGISEPESARRLPPSVPGRRVLVVDDEPDLVSLMLRLLREDGLIASAADPGEAQERIAERSLDLVITDVDMGPHKGTRLLEAARKLENPPAFILVTGDVLNAALAGELARLDVPVLAKPFLRTDFLRLVRRALAQSRARGG